MADLIKEKVVADVALYARLKPTSISTTDVLKDLGLDHSGFLALTTSLRAFVKFKSSSATLLVNEVEKKGLKVGGLIALVRERRGE